MKCRRIKERVSQLSWEQAGAWDNQQLLTAANHLSLISIFPRPPHLHVQSPLPPEYQGPLHACFSKPACNSRCPDTSYKFIAVSFLLSPLTGGNAFWDILALLGSGDEGNRWEGWGGSGAPGILVHLQTGDTRRRRSPVESQPIHDNHTNMATCRAHFIKQTGRIYNLNRPPTRLYTQVIG